MFLSRFSSALLCTLLAAFAFASGCRKPTDAKVDPPRILRISQRNEPADIDPANATLPDEFFIIRALSEGLVAPAPTSVGDAPSSAVLPAAASTWEVSASGMTYTFHLRKDAYWSNGDQVTAEDFLQSFRRVLTPETGAPKVALFYMVKNARAFGTGQIKDFSAVGFTAPDPFTLVVTLEHPMPQFLLYAASGPWIPVNLRTVTKFGRSWTRAGNFVSNGPFTLAEWRPNQRIVVKRNPKYHNAAAAKLDEIHFVACDNGDTEDRAYRAGQLDVTMAVPYAKLDTYERERPAELFHAPLAETRFLSFNTTKPPLNDARVRRALSLAIDRASLVERLLRGGQKPAERILPPQLRGTDATKSGIEAHAAYDPALGRQLLKDAGFASGTGFPHFVLSTWVNSPITEAIQQMWKKELGIEVGVEVREAKVHVASLRDGSYDIAIITAIPDVEDPANMLQEFATGSPNNYSRWSDARFDSLLEQASRETDDARRRVTLDAADHLLTAECPVAPLYFNAKNWLMSSRVRGWQHDALWTRFYLNAEIIESK